MLRQNSRTTLAGTSPGIYYHKPSQPYQSSFNLLATRCTMAPTNEVRLSVSESMERAPKLFGKLTNSSFSIAIFHRKNVQKMVRTTADLIELDKALQATNKEGTYPRLPPLDEKKRILSRHIFSRKSTAERLEAYLTKILNDVVLANHDAVKHFVRVGGEPEPSLSRRGSISSQSVCSRRGSIYSLAPPRVSVLRGYHIQRVLGSGSMGKVFLVRDSKTNQLRAMKSISKERALAQACHNLRTERSILAALGDIKSPFLVTLFNSFQTSSRLFFILDYHPGGDLATHIQLTGQFSEERAKFYACQIILGLKTLHDNRILYRDLKPENCLLSREGNVVLTDFGLSKRLERGNTTGTFCGTSRYLSPEVLHGEDYSFAVDWWSLGILFYEMLVGYTPFHASTDHEIYERVIQGNVEFPPHVSSGAASLIDALLIRDPRHRLGGELGAKEVVQYPYFEGVDWDAYKELRVPAPFVPSAPSPDEPDSSEFRFFDESFLSMDPSVSPCPSVASSSCSFASFQASACHGLS
ncbi:hypothetical protein DSO57_1026110 [Entomophthora muscae]|uniref:Uncharacterized protein n=1 Tax=Entomophthora muscae TaxID=34485 RepID=A0ACC2TPH1_9FUNG|nr:hypothetical protein DSO57_1026110 [Entomophthora muscae]